MIEIKIEGLDEVIQNLQNGINALQGEMVGAMNEAVKEVAEDAAIYPPETEANRPPPPYYVRGVGTQATDTQNLGESEQLGENWDTKVDKQPGEVDGIVSNERVTYAPHVHGDTEQKGFHGARGWRRMQRITSDNVKTVYAAFDKMADRLIRILGG